MAFGRATLRRQEHSSCSAAAKHHARDRALALGLLYFRETVPIRMSTSTQTIVDSSITATSGFIDGITMATTGEKATTAPMAAKPRGVAYHT